MPPTTPTYYKQGNYTILREAGQPAPAGFTPVTQTERPDLYASLPKTPNAPITSTVLSSNSTPITVPIPGIPTAATAISSTAQATIDQNKTAIEQMAAQDLANKKSALTPEQQNYITKANELAGIPQQQSQLESTPEYLAKKENLTKYTNDLEASQRRQLNEVRMAQENPHGMLAGAGQAQINEINRKYVFEQADISLNQMAAQRVFTDAQSMIDRKISLLTEGAKLQYDFAKTFYEGAKSDFTKSEDRQWQVFLNKQAQDIKTTETKATNAAKMAQTGVENNMPLNLYAQAQKLINEKKFDKANILSAPYQQSADLAFQTLSSTDAQGNKTERIVAIDKRTGKLVNANVASASTVASGNSIVNVNPAFPAGQAYENAFNSAVLGLPQASQKIATKTFSDYINNGNVDGARQYLIRMATQGLPAADQTQALGRAQATASLKEINTLLDNASQKGANTNLLTGSLVNIAQKLGATSNTDLSYIGARIQQQLQVYRRSMTGVAFSPQESKEYAKIFPDITNLDDLNKAKIKALTDAFDSNNRASLAFLLGGDNNYEQIFGKPQVPTLPSQQTQVNPFLQSISNIYNPSSRLFNIPD